MLLKLESTSSVILTNPSFKKWEDWNVGTQRASGPDLPMVADGARFLPLHSPLLISIPHPPAYFLVLPSSLLQLPALPLSNRGSGRKEEGRRIRKIEPIFSQSIIIPFHFHLVTLATTFAPTSNISEMLGNMFKMNLYKAVLQKPGRNSQWVITCEESLEGRRSVKSDQSVKLELNMYQESPFTICQIPNLISSSPPPGKSAPVSPSTKPPLTENTF